MFKEIFYSDDTLNIFTDASIKKYDNETIGCPGAICVVKGNVTDSKLNVLRHTTNNNSEITAIYYGILLAVKYKDVFKNINLFSDSKICVFGLREWIFNWIKAIQKESDNIEDYVQGYNPNILIGSTNQPVMNQSEIIMTIQTILANDLKINIYHQRGHVNVRKIDSLNNAKECFMKNNSIHDIDTDTIITLSNYNNLIDQATRDLLNEYEYSYIGKMSQAIYFTYNRNMDMDQYSKLLNLSSLNKYN